MLIGAFALTDLSSVARADDLGNSPRIESPESSVAPWNRPGRGGWGGGRRGYYVCTTRNVRGQTFRGDGYNQMQARHEANRYCRSRSFFCYSTGCRRIR